MGSSSDAAPPRTPPEAAWTREQHQRPLAGRSRGDVASTAAQRTAHSLGAGSERASRAFLSPFLTKNLERFGAAAPPAGPPRSHDINSHR